MEQPLKPSLAAAVAIWAAGWTLGAILLVFAGTTVDVKAPAVAVLTAVLVGLPAFAAPNYVATRMFGGRRPVLEALIWLGGFVVMWGVYAWVNVPPALNINTTETMRARQEYFRHHRIPPETLMALRSIAIYALVAGFASGVLNGSRAGWLGRLGHGVAFGAIVLASFAAAGYVFAILGSTMILLLVSPAIAGAVVGAGITLGRRALWGV